MERSKKEILSGIGYWLNQLTQELKGIKEELNHLNYRIKQTNTISKDKYNEVKDASNKWWANKSD